MNTLTEQQLKEVLIKIGGFSEERAEEVLGLSRDKLQELVALLLAAYPQEVLREITLKLSVNLGQAFLGLLLQGASIECVFAALLVSDPSVETALAVVAMARMQAEREKVN